MQVLKLLLASKAEQTSLKSDLVANLRRHAFLYLCGRYLNHVMAKPASSKCENKGIDQLCGNREADQRLCFR